MFLFMLFCGICIEILNMFLNLCSKKFIKFIVKSGECILVKFCFNEKKFNIVEIIGKYFKLFFIFV